MCFPLLFRLNQFYLLLFFLHIFFSFSTEPFQLSVCFCYHGCSFLSLKVWHTGVLFIDVSFSLHLRVALSFLLFFWFPGILFHVIIWCCISFLQVSRFSVMMLFSHTCNCCLILASVHIQEFCYNYLPFATALKCSLTKLCDSHFICCLYQLLFFVHMLFYVS